MAEEKKDTTKKSTPKKKEAVEEIKVEKRFCTKCGKELKEGEVCTCSANEPASSNATVNGDVIVNTCKNVWNTIINVFKRPASTIAEEIESKETNKSIILTVILAITFALYLMAILSMSAKSAAEATWGLTSSVVKVNYFQVFIYGILIYAIMAILPMVAALIVAKITKNSSFTFKKAFKLYITSNAPLTLVYLGMAIIFLINVPLLNVLGLIASLIISLACFFNFILGFNKETKIKDDSRSYAITGLMALWIAMIVVAFIIVGATLIGSMIDTKTSSLDNYSDIFNW